MKYISALDSIRALAVMIVVAFHVSMPAFKSGFLGVDIFFVLSGFLITSLLLVDSERSYTSIVTNFIMRRLFRIWPLLILVSASYAFLPTGIFKGAMGFDEFIYPVLFISNYTRALEKTPLIMSHSWSLALEMHFYLLWPIVFLILKQYVRQHLGLILFSLFLVASLWRIGQLVQTDSWYSVYLFTDTRLSGLMFGAFCAVWRPPSLAQRSAQLVAIICLLAIAAVIPLAGWKKDFSLIYTLPVVEIGTGALILAVSTSQAGLVSWFLELSWLRWMGKISYGIYLWHYPLARLFRQEMAPWLAFLATLGGGIILATLSYYLFEKPVRLQAYKYFGRSSRS